MSRVIPPLQDEVVAKKRDVLIEILFEMSNMYLEDNSEEIERYASRMSSVYSDEYRQLYSELFPILMAISDGDADSLQPLTTNLVVADRSRTEKTICLAVSPSLKAYGIPGRARLFEVEQKLREVNAGRRRNSRGYRLTGKSVSDIDLKAHPDWEVDYIAATPRMAYYIEHSTRIYKIYLN